jgi:hypothetical protein
MHEFCGFDALPLQATVIVSFAVRPDEIELALATNGDSLTHRLLLALVAELTTIENGEQSSPLDRCLPWGEPPLTRNPPPPPGRR